MSIPDETFEDRCVMAQRLAMAGDRAEREAATLSPAGARLLFRIARACHEQAERVVVDLLRTAPRRPLTGPVSAD